MRRLGHVLERLGAGSGDVVKMNRWYVAEGTADVWEPSARAVAAFFTEPGPVATAISLPGWLPDGALIRIELLGMIGIDNSPLSKSHAWPAGHWDWPIHLPYKHGLTCGDFTFVGGRGSIDQQARVLDPDDFQRQTLRSLGNIGRVLEAGADATAGLAKLGPITKPRSTMAPCVRFSLKRFVRTVRPVCKRRPSRPPTLLIPTCGWRSRRSPGRSTATE